MADVTHSALQVAQTLAFGIPPPYGVLAAAAIQVFEAFLPTAQPEDKEGEMLVLLRALPAEIGNNAALSEATSYLEGLTDAVGLIKEDWDKSQGTDSEITTLELGISRLIPLGSVLDVGPSDLANVLKPDLGATHGYVQGKAALNAAMNLMMGRIMAAKMIVELQAAKLAFYNRCVASGQSIDAAEIENIVKWLHTYFDDLCNQAGDYARAPAPGADPASLNFITGKTRHQVDDLVGRLRQKRAAGISDWQTIDRNYLAYTETHYFTDAYASDSSAHQCAHKDTSESVPAGPSSTWVYDCWLENPGKAQLNAVRQAYIDARLAEFDTEMAYTGQIFDAITAQLAQVTNIAPEAPADRPSVQWVPGVDPGYAPVADSSRICWGVRFQNEHGGSPIRWSAWADPKAASVPLLTLPTEPGVQPLSRSRQVFRLARPTSAAQPDPLPDSPVRPSDASMSVTIADNVTSHVYDQWPAVGSGLVPIPAFPPVRIVDGDDVQLVPVGSLEAACRFTYAWRTKGGNAAESPRRSQPSEWIRPGRAKDQVCVYPPTDPDLYELVVYRQDRPAAAAGSDQAAQPGDAVLATGHCPQVNPGRLWIFQLD